MSNSFKAGAAALTFVLIGVMVWLWTPGEVKFDAAAAKEAAGRYSARIIRDAYGVPHIYGERDADAAFGLAYAHAEDDWATMEEVLLFTRGKLAQRTGKQGAITDYLVVALGVEATIKAKYESDLTPQTRAIIEAYATGLNLWCAEDRKNCGEGVAPVTPHDIVAGFVARTPFFYGLDEQLTKLFDGDIKMKEAAESAREAFLNLDRRGELGSNAMAVAPPRSADGHTRLMVNSHQPFTGPVAWYEARVKSEEGWDMIGALFPGAPLILVGAGPKLGWAMTVNKPDLVDFYQLETDKKNPTKYKFDGEWRDFERDEAVFRVKLFGPLSLPVKRPVLRSVHGPVFETPNGFFSVAYAGAGDIRAVEQWFRMNKAQNFNAWREAMAMQAVPNFNVIYGDGAGNIAYYYNAAIPVRSADWDWAFVAPGDRADLVWDGVRPFGSAPSVINPSSGYVVNSNHTPFDASAPQDNPLEADYPPHFGITTRQTNRGLMAQVLYGSDQSITGDEFVAYKMDNTYAPDSRLAVLVSTLVGTNAAKPEPDIAAAVRLLSSWDGSTDTTNRAAGLAIRTGQLALGFLLNEEGAEEPDPEAALRRAIKEFEKGFGRIDPEWGEVLRLQRGDVDIPVNGGPDVLRAIYAIDNPKDGPITAMAGDTYVLYADWPQNGGAPTIQTIHHFGAATQNNASPHYADQTPLFAGEEFRTPPMTLNAVLAEATRDYVVGK